MKYECKFTVKYGENERFVEFEFTDEDMSLIRPQAHPSGAKLSNYKGIETFCDRYMVPALAAIGCNIDGNPN